jgi:hypothetical protein
MKLAKTYPIRLVCRLLGVPRSSIYYAAQPGTDNEAMLKAALLDLAGEWPTYGYRRLTAVMRRLGWKVNGKRVRRWMDELGIHGAPPTRTTRTTFIKSAWQLLCAQANLDRNLARHQQGVGRSGQVVGDIEKPQTAQSQPSQ